MGAFISIFGCFVHRPMGKQMKVKKALTRAIIRVIRCFICKRVEKLRKIKKDLIWAMFSIMRFFVFSPVERLRKIKKDLTEVIVKVIRWFISFLVEKPRKIKKDECFLEEIDSKESKVVENVEQSEKKVTDVEMAEEQIHFAKPVEKKQGACLVELHPEEPIGKKQDVCLLEEPIENIVEKEREGIIHVVADESRGSKRSPDGVLIPCTSLDSFINPISTNTSSDSDNVKSEECHYYQINSGTSQQVSIFKQDFEVFSLNIDFNNSEFVEEEKREAHSLEEQHSHERIGKKQEGCLLLELQSKEAIENIDKSKREVTKDVVAEQRRITHYSSFQKILLVGEGDFSFSASLAVAFGSASNMTATSLQSKALLRKNYGTAKTSIKNLTRMGCTVMYGVDPTKMASKGSLKGRTFDCIVFNFPLACFFPKERSESQLRRHRRLVKLFLKNAKEMIDENGEIHITHTTNGFLSEWNIEQLASSLGLRLIEALHFNCTDYPGYNTTVFAEGDDNSDCNPSITFKFGLENANNASQERGGRRRGKKKNMEKVGRRPDAYLSEQIHSEEPIENDEERAHEVILGVVAEEERGSCRFHNDVLIPRTCLDPSRNSMTTHTSHDQNDIEFEECEDYQNHSGSYSSVQQEVFASSDGYLSCEDPIIDDTLQLDHEVSGLDALIKSNDCVEGKKQYTCSTEEKNSQEPIKMKQEGCSLLELHYEEPLKKKQDECYLLELNSEESFENERESCLVKELQLEGQIAKEEGPRFLDGIHSKELFENAEERKPAVDKSVVVEEIWITHYSSFQKILLVGEGDFSFSASLAMAFGSASNMIATSLNCEEFLMKNYGCVGENINNLKTRGCKVMHGVDATKMSSNKRLKGMTFDRIVFNFPFAGFFLKEDSESQLRRHQQLVSLFLENAKKMINDTGEIHINHKSDRCHHKWTVEDLASAQGLRLIEAARFRQANYPGYRTKYGFGGDKDFNCNPSKTYKFGLPNASKINVKEKEKEKKEEKGTKEKKKEKEEKGAKQKEKGAKQKEKEKEEKRTKEKKNGTKVKKEREDEQTMEKKEKGTKEKKEKEQNTEFKL